MWPWWEVMVLSLTGFPMIATRDGHNCFLRNNNNVAEDMRTSGNCNENKMKPVCRLKELTAKIQCQKTTHTAFTVNQTCLTSLTTPGRWNPWTGALWVGSCWAWPGCTRGRGAAGAGSHWEDKTQYFYGSNWNQISTRTFIRKSAPTCSFQFLIVRNFCFAEVKMNS